MMTFSRWGGGGGRNSQYLEAESARAASGAQGAGIRGEGNEQVGGSDSKNTLYCSFCGKSQHEVRKLIAGPTVFICEKCVELCMDISARRQGPSLVKSRDGIPTRRRSASSRDDYVIGPGSRQRRCSRSPSTITTSASIHQTSPRCPCEVQHLLIGRPLRQDVAGTDAGANPTCRSPWPTHHAHRGGLRGEDVENIILSCCSRPTTMSTGPSAASSTSTRSTRFSRKSDNPSDHPRRVREASVGVLRSWKAPSPRCLRRAAASIPSRNSCGRHPNILLRVRRGFLALRRSSRRAAGPLRSAFGARVAAPEDRKAGRSPRGRAEDRSNTASSPSCRPASGGGDLEDLERARAQRILLERRTLW